MDSISNNNTDHSRKRKLSASAGLRKRCSDIVMDHETSSSSSSLLEPLQMSDSTAPAVAAALSSFASSSSSADCTHKKTTDMWSYQMKLEQIRYAIIYSELYEIYSVCLTSVRRFCETLCTARKVQITTQAFERYRSNILEKYRNNKSFALAVNDRNITATTWFVLRQVEADLRARVAQLRASYQSVRTMHAAANQQQADDESCGSDAIEPCIENNTATTTTSTEDYEESISESLLVTTQQFALEETRLRIDRLLVHMRRVEESRD